MHDLVHYLNAKPVFNTKWSSYYQDMCKIDDFNLEKIDYGYIHTKNVSRIRNWADDIHKTYDLKDSKHC